MKRLLIVLMLISAILFVVACGKNEAKGNSNADNDENIATMLPMKEGEYKNAVHSVMSKLSADKDIYVEQYGYAVNDNNDIGKENAALQLNTKVVTTYGDLVGLGTAPEKYKKSVNEMSMALTDASEYFTKVADSLTPAEDATSYWQKGLDRLDAALNIAYKLE